MVIECVREGICVDFAEKNIRELLDVMINKKRIRFFFFQ